MGLYRERSLEGTEVTSEGFVLIRDLMERSWIQEWTEGTNPDGNKNILIEEILMIVRHNSDH